MPHPKLCYFRTCPLKQRIRYKKVWIVLNNHLMNYQQLNSQSSVIFFEFVDFSPKILLFITQTKEGCNRGYGLQPSLTHVLKFIYSKKATKFCKIFTLLLSYVVPVKSKVKISQNFVAFSEYMIFTKSKYSLTYKAHTRYFH